MKIVGGVLNVLNRIVVQSRLDAKRFCRVRLNLVQALCQLVQVVSHHHDLPIRNADELASIRGARIATGLVIDLTSKFSVQTCY